MIDTSQDPRLGLPSASNTAFWQCAGQWQLEQTIPPEELAAMKSAHTEFIDSGNKVDKARETGNTLDLDETELELYENGIKFETMLVDRWVSDMGMTRADIEPGPCKERLWLHHRDTMDPIVSGESDVHYITKAKPYSVFIGDWKLVGPNVPRATVNTQLRILAVLKWRDMDNIHGIRVAINRCADRIGGWDWCDFTPTDLQHAENWIMQHLWMSKQPDAPRRPGSWCNHCPCKSRCVEAGAYAMLPVAMVTRFDAIKAGKGDDNNIAALVASLSHPDLLRLWHSDSIVRKILDEVDAHLKTLPAAVLRDMGLELPETGKNRKHTNVKEAFPALTGEGVEEDDIWNATEVSRSKLVEQIMLKRAMKKAQATKWLDALLAPHTTITTDSPSLKVINKSV